MLTYNIDREKVCLVLQYPSILTLLDLYGVDGAQVGRFS